MVSVYIKIFQVILKKKLRMKRKLNIYLYYNLKAKYVKHIKTVLTKEEGRRNCLSKKFKRT